MVTETKTLTSTLHQIILTYLDYDFTATFIYISSSYRAGSTDIPDPLSPLLPIVHRPR